MSERKVLNKYFPPDFDPAALPRGTKPKNNQQQVRLMLPMSIQCATCGDYISKGKKFNGRKEEVVGENYLGIPIYRLYFKCATCLSEITFKTDPKHSDYTVERGATRNFEPWKQNTKEEELARLKQEREEAGDAMKVLENRTEASKREMELQDAIEEVKELNARAAMLTTDQLLDIHAGGAQRLEEAQIEEMARQAFERKRLQGNGSKTVSLPDIAEEQATDGPAAASALPVIKRLPDAVDLAAEDFRPPAATAAASNSSAAAASTVASASSSSSSSAAASIPASSSSSSSALSDGPAAPLAGLVLVKKRKAKEDGEKEKKKKSKKEKRQATETAAAHPADTTPAGGLGGLLGSYDEDSD